MKRSNQKVGPNKVFLSLEELKEAETALLRFTQRQYYFYEFSRLEAHGLDKESSNNREQRMVKKTSHLYKLDPLLDGGLLKVGGRIGRATVSDDVKHPIIVPRKSHIAKLLIREEHETAGHAGRNHVLSNLRQRYWIIKGNAAVREVLESRKWQNYQQID